MKRNAIQDIKDWGENGKGPFCLYGIAGVGKTYLCREYAVDFLENYFYCRPEDNSETLKNILKPETDVESFITAYFSAEIEALKQSTVIFDDTEKAPEFFLKAVDYAVLNNCKWIFISEYNWFTDRKDITIKELFPLQFDEFLVATGTEWYVEAIRGHFQSGKKIPDIVHEELLSDFEEYLFTGGMPDVLTEYINQKSTLNVTKRQEIARLTAYNGLNTLKEPLKLKCNQIISVIDDQLKKENSKFMLNMIRTGLTNKMYEEAFNELERRGLIIKIEEITDNKKYTVYYPEFSLSGLSRSDEITDVELSIRINNYIIQTMREKGIKVNFWDSCNRAALSAVLTVDNKFIPVDIDSGRKNNSKSIISFKNKFESGKTLKISSTNFVEGEDFRNIPIYSLFCL